MNFQARHSKGTKSTYKSAQKHYFHFCRLYNLDPLIFTQQKIRDFIAYKDCLNNGLGPDAMRTHRYAVRAIAQSIGIELNVSDQAMPLLASDIAGKRRLQPRGMNASKAIDIAILLPMFQHLSRNDYNSQVYRALLSINHDMIKRASETTLTPNVGHAPQIKQLSWNQASSLPLPAEPQSLTYHYNIGKTNIDRKLKSATVICNCHTGICGMHELHLLLRWRQNLTNEDHIFVLWPKVIMTSALLGEQLKKLARKIGVDPHFYGKAHGLRKGGAQDQVEQDIPALLITNQADWASIRSMKPYFQNISEQRKIAIYKKHQ